MQHYVHGLRSLKELVAYQQERGYLATLASITATPV